MKWYWIVLILFGIAFLIKQLQRSDRRAQDYLDARRRLILNGGQIGTLTTEGRYQLSPGDYAARAPLPETLELIEPNAYPDYASDEQGGSTWRTK